MRIVLVSPSLPLPFGRTDARWLSLVCSELARRGIEVSCISVTEESAEAQCDAESLASAHGYHLIHVPLVIDAHPIARKVASLRRPFSETSRARRLVETLESELAMGYDVLHLEHLFTGWLARGRSRCVAYVHHLEVVDWEERRDLSARERVTLARTRFGTQRLLRGLEHVIVASDRLAIETSRWRAAPVPVVPIGIDTSLYPVLPAVDKPVVGVIGSMHWFPSRAAAARVLERLWPAIRARRSDASLVVAGWGSDVWLSSYFPCDRATLAGAVERPEDFFGAVSVLLYPPPRGSGMKVKVLEALAYGVPVVANTEGLEGLGAEAGTHVDRAEDDDDLVDATIRLLDDPELRGARRKAGRQLVTEQFAAVPAVDRLLDAYDRLGLA